jgi:subfamily B ATP-binding cassette protein HlyB/CyaB
MPRTSEKPTCSIFEPLDSGLGALCGIAAFCRIAADPKHLSKDLAMTGRLAGERDLICAATKIGLKARVVGRLMRRPVLP